MPPSFADVFEREVIAAELHPRRLNGECTTSTGKKCPLCWGRELTYNKELEIKQRALLRYWAPLFPRLTLSPLLASPKGRHYRTVSKRRAAPGSGGLVRLGLLEGATRPLPIQRCAIECSAHQEIFARVSRSRHAGALADQLNYVILKGTYDEHWLMLNLSSLASPLVATARKLSAELGSAISGTHLLLGRADDPYYMNATRSMKLYGKGEISATFGGKSFRYPLESFCQINHSIIDSLIATVGSMLTGQPLLDLYCGFGLFGLALPSPTLLGVDWNQPATAAARANAERQRHPHARFLARPLEAEAVDSWRLPPGFEVIVDPPRGGPAPGLIEALAARKPARVVHLFCDLERALPDLSEWQRVGYQPKWAVPLDLFPGTNDLELAVLLEP